VVTKQQDGGSQYTGQHAYMAAMLPTLPPHPTIHLHLRVGREAEAMCVCSCVSPERIMHACMRV